MRGNVIKIHDTKTGALLVPYTLSSNAIFLSSNADGNLLFVESSGKMSIVNIYLKKTVLESASSIQRLLAHLRATNTEKNRVVSISDVFCGSNSEVYMVVEHLEEIKRGEDEVSYIRESDSLWSLNADMDNWERVEGLSEEMEQDQSLGNSVSVHREKEDAVYELPGFLQVSL